MLSQSECRLREQHVRDVLEASGRVLPSTSGLRWVITVTPTGLTRIRKGRILKDDVQGEMAVQMELPGLS